MMMMSPGLNDVDVGPLGYDDEDVVQSCCCFTDYELFFQARNKGADLASAPVLIFLYANTECSPGWVEPLVDRIVLNRSIIASPSRDIIDQDTGKYNLVLPESRHGKMRKPANHVCVNFFKSV